MAKTTRGIGTAIIPIFTPNIGCTGRCVFCNQAISGGDPVVPDEIAGFIERALSMIGVGRRDRIEVAFYGGDILNLDEEASSRCLAPAARAYREGRIDGIRLSTRCGTLTRERIDLLRASGVTTIEIGLQSTDYRVLALNGRAGDYAPHVIDHLRIEGFEIGIHLMYGLFGESAGSVRASVRDVIGMTPDFVRLHPTLVFRGTRLEELFRNGEYEPLTMERAIEGGARMKAAFEMAGIRVARIGLQVNERFAAGVVAGPVHEALGEIVESRIVRDAVVEYLGVAGERGTGGWNRSERRVRIAVNPRYLSKLKGQRSSNMAYFGKLGYSVEVEASSGIGTEDLSIDEAIVDRGEILNLYMASLEKRGEPRWNS